MSDGMSQLPMVTGAPDQLQFGISAGASNSVVHPVQAIERTFARQQDANQKSLLARVYGAHLPMQLHMEQSLLSQFRRAPGLPSSSLGLSIVMGQDEDIDWGDVMNRPENSEQHFCPLSEMEHRMNGTQKRRVF